MREDLKGTIKDRVDRAGIEFEKSNVADAVWYLPLAVPLMAIDYITERLGYDLDITIVVLDFLRYKVGLTTQKHQN